MLNIVNEREKKFDGSGGLTVDERKSILQRALNAVPFFNILSYDIIGEATKRRQYQGKLYVNLDFYLTDIRGNFNRVAQDTGTEWNVNIYLANTGKSVYGFNKSQAIPTPFVMTDARSSVAYISQEYDDRQRETIPFLIPKGQEVITEAVNVGTKAQTADAKILLAGFNLIPYPYLGVDETEKINRSLESDPVFQMFRLTVEHNGQRFYNFFNDNLPRVILGFGIVDSSGVATIPLDTMTIFDSTRSLKMTNEDMPVEFIAPRIPSCRDTHIYYLPIEYYFMPFGNLRFKIDSESDGKPYELVMLTRTI